MEKRFSIITRPSSLFIFLLLVVLSLPVGPLAAQKPTTLCTDASVMSWDATAANGTTFTMMKDCTIQTSETRGYLEIGSGKTFTINGAGYTIWAADKARYSYSGTVFTFGGIGGAGQRIGENINLTLRNVTIRGGGTARTGAAFPNAAINVGKATVLLDGAKISLTRGGAIKLTDAAGRLTLKNAKLNQNKVSGTGAAGNGNAVTVVRGTVTIQNLLTMKNNTGGGPGAIYIAADGVLNIDALGCKDVAGNENAAGTTGSNVVITDGTARAAFSAIWSKVPTKADDNCDENTAPVATPAPTATATTPPSSGGGNGNGGDDGMMSGEMAMDDGDKMSMAMSMADSNYERRIKGTAGSDRSAYYRSNSGGALVLQIYRVDSNSVGHWVMNVSQATVDAMGGAGCVAASPDGRYAVRVWPDGNVTVSDGPDMESKILHNTFMGGVTGGLISTDTTYSSTPPGVGCPGYIG